MSADVVVLCYHGVSETWPARISVRPERFAAQLDELLRRGYRAATFYDAVTARSSAKTFVVTFDDAFRSVRELAFPILEERGVPASVYAVTDFVGRPGPMIWDGVELWLDGQHEHELAGLDWDDLRALAAAGWEVGSHSRTHAHLTRLDDAELASELRGSRERVEEELGGACRSVAYPYGDWDERVVAAARAAGYSSACTLPRRLHKPRPLAWPRIGVYFRDTDRQFELKIARPLRRLRASPAWHLVDVALRVYRLVRRKIRGGASGTSPASR